jgi:hypothetical protein
MILLRLNWFGICNFFKPRATARSRQQDTHAVLMTLLQFYEHFVSQRSSAVGAD